MSWELETVRRDGANGWMWVRGEAEKDEAGEIVGLWGAAQDITIRKQAEIDRERLLSAIEQSHETIVITDTDGNIQYTNPSFEETSGYSCSEVQGQNPRVLKSGVQDQTFYKQLWETISAGNTWTGRMVNKRKDGALYTEDVAITPVKDRQGIIVNYVGVKRDVTKDLELEKRISQAQRMEAIGTLAGGIAHDFNNLLFPIIGISEMLLEDLPEESLEYENAKEILFGCEAGKRSGTTDSILQQTIQPAEASCQGSGHSKGSASFVPFNNSIEHRNSLRHPEGVRRGHGRPFADSPGYYESRDERLSCG